MILEVKDGCFGYSKEHSILKNLNFRLEDKEIMTVLGQNGIGKTTLLKCLTGILKWQSGKTIINGKEIKSAKSIKSIGYVPQAHKLSFPYSVREVVTMGRVKHMNLFSVPTKFDRDKADQAINDVGIQHLSEKPCTQLSGGQLQLAFIARALAGEPKMIILDEPESHLDFKNQFVILDLIYRLAKERGISCIINTHYPDHALRMSDKTLMMGKDGYILGKTENIITEENVSKFFHVKSKIIKVSHNNNNFNSFVVVENLG